MLIHKLKDTVSDPTITSPSPTTRRLPWLAALLSLLLTGLGHVYTGRPKRAATLWLATFLLSLIALFLVVVLPSVLAVVAFVVLLIGPPVAVAVDAWRAARVSESAYPLRWYNRWYWYAAAIGLASFVVKPRLKTFLEGHIVQAYRLPSGSMAPAYEAGDFLLVSPLRSAPRRGDVVVYRATGGAFFKRVVAGPGDTVAMRDGKLLLNGRVVQEPYEVHDSTDPVADDFKWQRDFLAPGVNRATYVGSLHTWGPLVVPTANYFVLGDNRNNSLDSRYVGFVPRASITARPFLTYFSWDSTEHSVRWRRLGLAH